MITEGIKIERTHYTGDVRSSDVGQEVTLMGWINRRRDHGSLIFLDLRDRQGIVQVVLDPKQAPGAYGKAHAVRNEYVIAIKGVVRLRPEGMANENLGTGEVEVNAKQLWVLNEAEPPLFAVDGMDFSANEDLRLRYRFLDLRRPQLQGNLLLRHKISRAVRQFLDANGCVEIETPMLTRSTPEGARDFIVPSRMNFGKFYALPQSPQLFKQLMVISGIDRYYQLARCFRDEDLRAERQPEFTQIDIEMSFVDSKSVMDLAERMMKHVFKETICVEFEEAFPRLTYQEAMDRFGCDAPDMRYALELCDITESMATSGFEVFARVHAKGGIIKGINAIGAGKAFSRNDIDGLSDYVTTFGAKGLAWIRVQEDGTWNSPILKFIKDEEKGILEEVFTPAPGDLLLIVAGPASTTNLSLSKLRHYLAERLDMIPENEWKFCWITEFPMFEWDEDEKRHVAMHHPFTSPKPEDFDMLENNPGEVRAQAYDLALNGTELGGGSIRNHIISRQERVFKALGMSDEVARDKFGFLLEALRYGAPPHGGVAFGLDRLCMFLAGVDSIREVIAFPKTQSGRCLLTEAPSEVDETQLRDLGVKLRKGVK